MNNRNIMHLHSLLYILLQPQPSSGSTFVHFAQLNGQVSPRIHC